MRLYLSSFGFGNHPEKLVTLVGSENKQACIILNALDYRPEARSRFLKDQTKVLADLGFTVG